ncbi:hypothetical protein EKH55_0833 [Sinorhizobium alkalisoli]|nr:hypothetical protein EKH55_0833 [Sinorhizobium alkalisoli]
MFYIKESDLFNRVFARQALEMTRRDGRRFAPPRCDSS